MVVRLFASMIMTNVESFRRASDYEQYSEDLQKTLRMLEDEIRRRTEAERRLAPLQVS